MTSSIQTAAQLRALHLTAFAQAFELQLQQPKLNDIPFDERVALLVDAEMTARQSRKLSRLVRTAQFPDSASLEDLDARAGRGLDKSLVAMLGSCSWIQRQQNLLINGPTGVGKTWLACALGSQACRRGHTASFYKMTTLYEDISAALHSGTLTTMKAALVKPQLLILDDFGMGQMTPTAAQMLYDVADARYRFGSLIITSQYPTDKWTELFTDPTVGEAFLDRTVHQAHRINLKGESMRKSVGKGRLEAQH